MNNIFTNIPEDVLTRLHPEKYTRKTFESIETFIFRFTPLAENVLGEHAHLVMSFAELHEQLSQALAITLKQAESANSGTYTLDIVMHISELTLDLCKDYISMPQAVTFPSYPPNNELYYAAIDPHHNLKSWMDELRRNFFDRDELRNFLLLSYFYSDTFEKDDSDCIGKKDWQDYIDAIHGNENAAGSTISEKLGNFKRGKPLFLSAFMMHPEKADTQKKNPFHLRTPLDLPVITSIINTTSKSTNPFMIEQTTANANVDLGQYLRKSAWMFHHSSRIKGDTIQKQVCQEQQFSYYTADVAYIYDQFLLERLAGINFINALYALHDSTPDSIVQTLGMFMSSPLCNARMRLLKFQERMQKDGQFQAYIAHEWNERVWNTCLTNLLEYHLNCTLPILDVVFHYLMALAFESSLIASREEYMQSMEKYFSNLCVSEDLAFYHVNSSGLFCPKRSPIPFDGLNKKLPYGKFAFNVYIHFYQDIIRRSAYNLFRIVELPDIREMIAEKFCVRLTNRFPSMIDGIVTD